MLLNVVIFMWYGAVCPWQSFVTNKIVPIHRLIPLGLLILLLRRPPFILGLHKKIPQIEGIRQATFMGFFGPIGCSAIFYLYITVDFVETLKTKGGDSSRGDVENLAEAVRVIVWFMVIVSVVVHGLSIPLGKLGFYLPRTISRSLSAPGSIERPSFQMSHLINDVRLPRAHSRNRTSGGASNSRITPVGRAFKIGGSIIVPPEPAHQPQPPSPERGTQAEDGLGAAPPSIWIEPLLATQPPIPPYRTIRFPDEASRDPTQQPKV
ncbi:hypothetical protein ANO14919_116210 [Xylariales sp. No.14919]|nr:hypothetical protein ANO14919_116210 [Xylariales sp. No.14919]